MKPNVDRVLEDALQLSPEEQRVLVDSLLERLLTSADPDVQAAWDEEIARRIRELDSGQAETHPWSEVRKRLLARIDARQDA